MTTAINPYLMFPGKAEEAFKFYKSVFGGEFVTLQRYKDAPREGMKASAEDLEKIMHISLPIGKGNIMMASDSLESMGHPVTMGNNFYLSVDAESREDANRLFSALSAGGKATVPMADQFWGSYFGMLVDKFGVQWMVGYTQNPPK